GVGFGRLDRLVRLGRLLVLLLLGGGHGDSKSWVVGDSRWGASWTGGWSRPPGQPSGPSDQTVTVTAQVSPSPRNEAVMVGVPAPAPVTYPASTVAAVSSLDVHVAEEDTSRVDESE